MIQFKRKDYEGLNADFLPDDQIPQRGRKDNIWQGESDSENSLFRPALASTENKKNNQLDDRQNASNTNTPAVGDWIREGTNIVLF